MATADLLSTRICEIKIQAQVKICEPAKTHQQVPYDDDHQEEDQTRGPTWDLHAVPRDLDPLSKQDPDDDVYGVEEAIEMPTWKVAVDWDATDVVFVILLEQLHAHHAEHEDHDEQNQSQVPKSPHRGPDELYQHAEGRPPLGQPEHSHLHRRPFKTLLFEEIGHLDIMRMSLWP